MRVQLPEDRSTVGKARPNFPGIGSDYELVALRGIFEVIITLQNVV